MKTFVLEYADTWWHSDHSRYNCSLWSVNVAGTAVQGTPTPARNERTRGRHDPGSGDYQNRWVFSPEGRKVGFTRPGKTGTVLECAAGEWYFPAEGGENGSQKGIFSNGVDGRYGHMSITHQRVGTADENWTVQIHAIVIPERITNQPSGPGWAWVYLLVKALDATWVYQNRNFPTPEACREKAHSIFDRFVAEWQRPYGLQSEWWGSNKYPLWDFGNPYYLPGSEPAFSIAPETYGDAIDLGIGAGRRMQSFLANAYVQAVDGLPDLSGMGNAVNAIQLIEAGLGILRGIVSRNIGRTLGSLSDAWLGYRYAFGTTKSDIMEVANYLNRASDLLFTDRVRSNGTVHFSPSDGDRWTFRCSIELSTSVLSSLKSTIEKYGLQLDGYAMWDLVPFSFIVDWFLDIGGLLEYARRQNFARRVVPDQCWCSVERRWTNEYGCEEIFYRRWAGQPDVSASCYVRHQAGGVTIVKRGLDFLALIAR